VHPGFAALRRAALELSAEEGWLVRPVEGWIPANDVDLMSTRY
jgi:hypothetical protein